MKLREMKFSETNLSGHSTMVKDEHVSNTSFF